MEYKVIGNRIKEDNPETKTIGEKITRLRKEKNMSQGELSKLTGISQQLLSLYETGKRTPKIHNLVLIADNLEINPFELLPEHVSKLPSQLEYGNAVICESLEYIKEVIKILEIHTHNERESEKFMYDCLFETLKEIHGIISNYLEFDTTGSSSAPNGIITAIARNITSLNETGKEKALDYILDLNQIGKYTG